MLPLSLPALIHAAHYPQGSAGAMAGKGAEMCR